MDVIRQINVNHYLKTGKNRSYCVNGLTRPCGYQVVFRYHVQDAAQPSKSSRCRSTLHTMTAIWKSVMCYPLRRRC